VKLYMVSLGPGDYELITIKALKALKSSNAICIPTKSKDGSFEKSITYKIVKELMDEFNFSKPLVPVYTPMKFRYEDWQKQVDLLISSLDTFETVSFVTLGDSAIYSTVYYLLDIIAKDFQNVYKNCEVIAGVTSFSEASARVKKPLCRGKSSLKIVPLLDKQTPSTTVYMRPKTGMNSANIKENGCVFTFENLNLQEENILNYKKEKVDKYMTLFIDFIDGN